MRRASAVPFATASLALPALLAFLAFLVACERGTKKPAGSSAPRRVLFVTWDTTRADHVGAYGGKARTPCFDALAARGVLYEQASSVAPITLPSHVSLLTGVEPCAHGVRDNALFELAPQARLLPEALREHGFRTAAFVAAYVLDPKYGLGQGFDVYDAPDASRAGSYWGVVERPAAAVVDAALGFVQKLARDDRFFLWVHFYDPHSPYAPPPSALRDGLDPYDAEIEVCDRELARLMDDLRARGLDDGLITVVTADHGESLGEHGEKSHGVFVYEATLRVPLVIAPPPPGVAPGTRVATRVSNVDLAVTLLERLGLERATLPDARTLALPARDADADGERALLAESFSAYYSRRWSPLRSITWREFKYVDAPRPELYSLADDPHELRDLAAERTDVRDRLAARLAALTQEHAPLGWEGKTPVTADDVRRLEQLGYAVAGASVREDDNELPADLADPKDHVAELDLRDALVGRMREASALLGLDGASPPPGEHEPERRERGRALFLEAKELLAKLRAANPDDTMLLTLAPSIDLGLGDWAAAAAGFEKLVAINPEHAANHFNLAGAYVRMGRVEWAVREMEKAAHLDPQSLFAPRWLMEMAASRRDWPSAAWWIDRLLERGDLPPADRAALEKIRVQAKAQLELVNGSPRPPAPVTEADLAAEGVRTTKRGGS